MESVLTLLVLLLSVSACAFDPSGLAAATDALSAEQADAEQADAPLTDGWSADASADAFSADAVYPDAALLDADLICPGYSLIGSRWYRSGTADWWPDAHTNCEADGGYLVAINDAAENAVVMSLVVGAQSYIGLVDWELDGVFVWLSGEPLSYTNWHTPGQPSGEMFVSMATDGTWYDLDSGAPNNYICECD